MLTEIFGLEWYKVHDEAEQLEHAVSADFERKLVERLGPAGACPHGNIVGMDSPADRRERGLKLLAEVRPGERITVASVFERDRKLLEYLDEAGVRPGARLEAISAGKSLELRAGRKRIRLDAQVGTKIWVKA
jgi:DtxR family Mn-dependent transcriptional regulator